MDTQTPIAPIMQINKDDKRFVESYDVAKNIDDVNNFLFIFSLLFMGEFQTKLRPTCCCGQSIVGSRECL